MVVWVVWVIQVICVIRVILVIWVIKVIQVTTVIYFYFLRSAMQTAKYLVMTVIDKWIRYKYYFCQ